MAKNDQFTLSSIVPNRRFTLWDTAIVILIISGFIITTSRSIADPDLWGHLRFGLDTINNHGLLRFDPYSYLTESQLWINHEWLAEVIFAFAWNLGDATGLIALKTCLWVLTYLVIFLILIKPIKSTLRVGILIFLSMPLTFPFFVTIRPHSFTALLYSLTLIILYRAESGQYKYLWGFIPIFALWPNLHGAFLAGGAILFLWAILHLFVHRNSLVWMKVILPLLLSGIATLINPYGFDLLAFLFSHISDARHEIVEWRPMEIFSLTGAFYLTWLALLILGLFFSRKPRNWVLISLLLISALLPFIAIRFIVFFIFSTVILAGEHIGNSWERIMPLPSSSSRKPIWVPLIVITLAILMLRWKWTNFSVIPVKNPDFYPIASVSILHQSNTTGNLAIHFDWGDFAIWHLSPSIKVSVDSRREMAYSEQIYKENIRFMTGIGDWSALIEDHPTQLALVKSSSPTDNLLKKHQDWIEVYRDEISVIYSSVDYDQYDQLMQVISDYEKPKGQIYFP